MEAGDNSDSHPPPLGVVWQASNTCNTSARKEEKIQACNEPEEGDVGEAVVDVQQFSRWVASVVRLQHLQPTRLGAEGALDGVTPEAPVVVADPGSGCGPSPGPGA